MVCKDGGEIVLCRQRRVLGGVAAFMCEIPAFAGMVYLGTGGLWTDLAAVWAKIAAAGGDNAVFADTFPFTRGPFLRRQESHSVVPATIGKNPHTHSRSPRDHSCVGRNLTVSCRQMRQGRALPFEIPAFAGMVYLGTGDLWVYFLGNGDGNAAGEGRCPWRFLISQE